MKKLLFLLTMLLSLTTVGQIELYNISLTDSTMNVVFEGRRNYIRIIGVDSLPNLMLVVNDSSYKVDSTKNDLYFFYPGPEKSVSLKVLVNDSITFSKQYDCQRIPNYKPILGKTTDTLLTKEEIISDPNLKLILPDCIFKVDYYIVKFGICYLFKNNRIKLPKGVGDYRLIHKRDH